MCFRHKEQYSTWFNYHEFNFELLQRNTAWKAIFSISRRPEKMVFPKELRWNIIFFKLSGNMIFFPPKIWSYPQMENEDDLSQKKQKKNQGNMIFSWNVLKRWYFQKGLRWDIIFLVLSGRVLFFSWKHGIFLPRRKMREMTFRKKYTETWYFLFDMFHFPLLKKSKMILPRRNTLKGDWHSRSRP